MGKKGTERRVYTAEFKAEAVALAGKHEKPISRVAKDLGLNESMLRRWMHEAQESAGTGVKAFPGRGTPSLPACGKRTKRLGTRRTYSPPKS